VRVVLVEKRLEEVLIYASTLPERDHEFLLEYIKEEQRARNKLLQDESDRLTAASAREDSDMDHRHKLTGRAMTLASGVATGVLAIAAYATVFNQPTVAITAIGVDLVGLVGTVIGAKWLDNRSA